jgi:hypothetical protein
VDAHVGDHQSWRCCELIRAWAEAIDVSNQTLEHASGLYVGHILSGTPTRRMGAVSRDVLLEAMALKVKDEDYGG